jgi:hypothetical protein
MGIRFPLVPSPHRLEVIAPAMASLLTFLDVALFALVLVLLKALMSKKSNPLPPGPRKLPLLENLLDMPTSHEWFKFAEWGEKWGTFSPTLILPDLVITHHR